MAGATTNPSIRSNSTITSSTTTTSMLLPPSTATGMDQHSHPHHDAILSLGPLWPHVEEQAVHPRRDTTTSTNGTEDAQAASSHHHQQLLPTDKRKKKWRKPKDKPKRPLSAYNLFFQIERQRLINEGGPSPELIATAAKGSKDKKSKKYGFAGLARHIASKWKDLEEDQMAYYQGLADKEQVRYMKDLVQWKIHEAQVKYDGDDSTTASNKAAASPAVTPPATAASHGDDDLSLSSASLATTASMQKSTTAVSSSMMNNWSSLSKNKAVVAALEPETNQMTAARCMGDSLFGGFDDGTLNLSSIIQELAREQQQQHVTTSSTTTYKQEQQEQEQQQQEMMEPLPYTTPVMEFANTSSTATTTGTSMADIYRQIATFAMPPPSFMTQQQYYQSTMNNSNDTIMAQLPPPSSSSPSLQQLQFDLDEEEQDFLIAFLAAS